MRISATMPTRIAPNVLSWASELDERHQGAGRPAPPGYPILAGPLALMPDAHLGMGATIGSVIATGSAVIPSAVGVDIGCGMAARALDLSRGPASPTPVSTDGSSRDAGPSRPAWAGGTAGPSEDGARRGSRRTLRRRPWSVRAVPRTQLGTLGSGNHFVEIADR